MRDEILDIEKYSVGRGGVTQGVKNDCASSYT